MRVVKEFTKKDIRISVFSWNGKYLLKYEQGMIEQTYKVSEMDILEEDDLQVFFTESFLDEINKRFEEMHQSLRNQVENI
ncbi:hypothetical protein [Echinicola vietnamensis]|uniref:Uncharacterized protein n=1 Tax=Echinicola vietnamensis (strain DSM 17526 / LMG 23754 / KMM 6221) TaxID=926556 RepID=L0G1G2_ECHVK|nr:hypothetical protein [Echinicola vietnamensis]AGA78690.1 hypothetical protein Echvi_2443 [Echinicola vietnamensis DSM 17526]